MYFVEIPVCILQKDGKLTSAPRGTEGFFQKTKQPPRPTCAPAPNTLPYTGDEQAKAGPCFCGRLRRHISPHLYLGAAFLLLSSCQSQAHKYCRLSHRGAGKRRHMLHLPNAMQHPSNRKDFIAKDQKFNCQAVSEPSTPTYTHTPG